MQEFASLLPLVAIFLIFWLLVIRPARKRQQVTRELQAGLKAGDRVMLTSGIFGTLTGAADDQVTVEIAPGVVVTCARGAVAAIAETASAPADGESDLSRGEEA